MTVLTAEPRTQQPPTGAPQPHTGAPQPHTGELQPHTGELLRTILLTHAPARRRWQMRVVRQVPGVNQAAVCQVLGSHLIDIGERACWEPDRTLKDTVSRAFGGRLTGATLRHFIDAFDLTPEQAETLWVSMEETWGPGVAGRP